MEVVQKDIQADIVDELDLVEVAEEFGANTVRTPRLIGALGDRDEDLVVVGCHPHEEEDDGCDQQARHEAEQARRV